MPERFCGLLYHRSKDPQGVIMAGFDPGFSSSPDGVAFFTDVPQPDSNVVSRLDGEIILFKGHEYGYNDPSCQTLIYLGFDGIRRPVQKGDAYVQIGETEIVLFPGTLTNLTLLQSYYYGEDDPGFEPPPPRGAAGS